MKPRTNPATLNAYRNALGHSPADLTKRNVRLKAEHLSALMSEYERTPSYNVRRSRKIGEIWPLVSHHTLEKRGLFGINPHTLKPRALTLLMIHDGLVIADPLQDILKLWQKGLKERALEALRLTTAELAQLEPLLKSGALELTQLRPALDDHNRAAILATLGLTPDMKVFTNFMEAAVAIPELPPRARTEYTDQARELFNLFGLAIPTGLDVTASMRRVNALGAAIIEVSWQLAVVASNPHCDLAVRGPLERHLIESVIAAGIDVNMRPGRHFSRLSLGDIPNLDSRSLSIADALAIRNGDAFSQFRDIVRRELDQLDLRENSGMSDYQAVGSFEEAMMESARELREKISRSSVRRAMADGALGAAVGAASAGTEALMHLFDLSSSEIDDAFSSIDQLLLTLTPAGSDFATEALRGSGIAITLVVLKWLHGRHEISGNRVAHRYYSILGGEPPNSGGSRHRK